MDKTMTSGPFTEDQLTGWEPVEAGVRRKILAWDKTLMLVKVAFETGGIGTVHRHPQVQISYVEQGIFEVMINDVRKTLHAGDCFYVPSDVLHGVECLQAGVLLDSFSPVREDFLQP